MLCICPLNNLFSAENRSEEPSAVIHKYHQLLDDIVYSQIKDIGGERRSLLSSPPVAHLFREYICRARYRAVEASGAGLLQVRRGAETDGCDEKAARP